MPLIRHRIFFQFLLVFMVPCLKGNILHHRQQRATDPRTVPPNCNAVITENLEPDTPEGTVLVHLSKYVFMGAVELYGIEKYSFNGKDLQVNHGFRCNETIFSDNRRFLCMRDGNKLEVRNGSGLRNIKRGSKIEIDIWALNEDNEGIGLCSFEFRIPFKPTLIPFPTTSRPSTTITTTKTTTTTHKMASTLLLNRTLFKTRMSTILHTEKGKPNATSPTREPCPGEKILKGKLEACKPITVELPTILANKSLQASFEYKIDLPASAHILKAAFVKVGSYKHHLESNSTFTLKVFYGSGVSKSLFKSVRATLGQEQAAVPVDKFIPTRNSHITVELRRNNARVHLPGELVSLVIDKYDFCFENMCLDHYYHKKDYVGRSECMPIVDNIPTSHFDTCFAVCPAEMTASSNGSYLWPLTFPNSIVTQPCKKGTGNVSRVCSKVDNRIPRWKQVNVKDCKSAQDQRSVDLQNLENVAIDASNASEASEKLKNISQSDPLTMPPSQLNSIAKILEELSTFASNEKVANDMLDTVDNCMDAPSESLFEGQRTSNVSKRMVTILSDVCGAILLNKTTFTMSKKGFAIAGSRESKSSFQGVVISYVPTAGLNSTNEIKMDRGTNKADESSSTSIHLPGTLLSSQGTDRNDLVFIAYDQGKLFQELGPSRLNSKIISAEVRNSKISGLYEPVVTKFKIANDTKGFEPICAWWDFNLHDGAGGWSSIGCVRFETGKDGYVECHCNHLTNFAVLLGAKIPDEDTTHELALKLISYIGIGISLAGTFFTLISYIIFPKLRDNAPPKILMNLCAALIFLQAIFLIGVERTSPRQGCQAVAFLLQYVLLCVLSWSGVEGFFSYRGIVMPMKSEVQNLMLKGTMFGWVVPILFPILGIAVWPDEYGDKRSCAVKGMPLYITVVVPVGLVMLLNLFSIISIMAALNKSSKMYPHNAFNAWHRLRIIAAFVLLFGLTWFFGFLVIANDIVVFQYLFCILNSLQGFFLFVFYGVRNENVRKSWLDKFHTYRERRAFSTSAGTKRTESTIDSATFNKSDSLRSNSLRKCKEIDSKDIQFQVHLQARANVYEAPPSTV